MINIDTKALEAEIISALICDSDTHSKIKELNQEHFTNKYNKYFFNIIQKLYLNKQEISFMSIRNAILGNEKSAKLSEIVMSYVENFITSSSIDSTIAKLKDITSRKKMQSALKKAMDNAENMEQELDSVKNNLIAELKEITDSKVAGSETITEILMNTLEEIEKQKDKKGMTTGFWKLDVLTDGLHDNELTCIGARPRNR